MLFQLPLESVPDGAAPSRIWDPAELNWITSGEISPRQLEMLRLYICGMSYSEIAKEMNCTTSGVRWNFQEMIAKAGYNCKEDLIAAALESKLIVTTLK